MFFIYTMMNLKDENISYLILPSDKWVQTISYLYSKEYKISEMLTYENNIKDKALFTYNEVSNKELKKDTLFILEHFDVDYGFIKYKKSQEIYKIYKSGNEIPVDVDLYESCSEKKKYVLGTLSFSFRVLDRYIIVDNKDQIKEGIEVEYLNNNKWSKKIVENVDLEWTKLYSLLSKYKKLRIKQNLD